MKKLMLKECVESIRLIRTFKHGELDPSVIAELKAVVHKLELSLRSEGDSVNLDRDTLQQTLVVIGKVAIVLDWVRRISKNLVE